MSENTVSADEASTLKTLHHGKQLPAGVTGAKKVKTVALAYTAVAADSGAILLCSTDNGVVTLPLAADVPGMELTLINAAADDAAKVSFSPNAADRIRGTVASVSASGTVDKDWSNTKSGANRGDWTKIVSDGGTSWYIVGGVGVWASES